MNSGTNRELVNTPKNPKLFYEVYGNLRVLIQYLCGFPAFLKVKNTALPTVCLPFFLDGRQFYFMAASKSATASSCIFSVL